MHASDFIVRFFAACSEHVYSECFHKSSETITRKTGYCAHENEREPDVWQKPPSKEADRDMARRSTPTADVLLCIVYIYIANMQYIHTMLNTTRSHSPHNAPHKLSNCY